MSSVSNIIMNEQQVNLSPFMIEKCENVIKYFRNMEISVDFRKPVETDKIPDYLNKISTPMDFSTVSSKLKNNRYSNLEEWARDVRLIFDNAIKYNPDDHPTNSVARYLKKKFDKKYALIQCYNPRNYEHALIKYTKEYTNLVKNKPDNLPYQTLDDQLQKDIENFSRSRFKDLANKLSKNNSPENQKRIKDIIQTDPNFQSLDNSHVDLSVLSRKTLLELEKLVATC